MNLYLNIFEIDGHKYIRYAKRIFLINQLDIVELI